MAGFDLKEEWSFRQKSLGEAWRQIWYVVYCREWMCEKLWTSLLLMVERRKRKSNFSIFIHWFQAVNHVFPHKLFRNLSNPALMSSWNCKMTTPWEVVNSRSKSHWGPSLSGLWTYQHQGQSLMSGALVRNDRDGPSCATLAWGRARLGFSDRPRWLNQRGPLLVPENKWHGQPHSCTAYDFTTSYIIPFLEKTVLNCPKWNQKVD